MRHDPLNLVLYVLGVILVILGVVWIFSHALLWGIIAIVVGLICLSHEGYLHRR